MNVRFSLFFAATTACVVASVVAGGCSSDKPAVTPPPVIGDCPVPDPENPPAVCGPTEIGLTPAEKCPDVTAYTCPTDNPCMAAVAQSGDKVSLRMGRIKLYKPNSLVDLAKLAVDPNVDPACFKRGAESFNWLLQIDKAAKKLTTGGAHVSTDHKTFAFATDSIDGTKPGSCPGFVGAPSTDLSPVTANLTFTGDTFTSDKLGKVNVPIFMGTEAIILPLQDAFIKNATLSSGGSCIGRWEKDFACDSVTRGWTTGGVIVAKITIADADKVPVKDAACQSLCAVLVADSTKTEGKTCKKNADGTYPEVGDTCVGGTGCKNAFMLSAGFAAYGITIDKAPPPPVDSGTDAPADAPSDAPSDAPTDVSDSADGG